MFAEKGAPKTNTGMFRGYTSEGEEWDPRSANPTISTAETMASARIA
jgi:hypothetical protein